MSLDSRFSASAHSYSRERSPKNQKEGSSSNDCCLYVTNINPHSSSTQIKEIFEKYGIVKNVNLIQHPITRQSRGFGFVLYTHPDDAQQALKNLNGKEVDGKRLRVEFSRRDRPHEPTPGLYRGPPGASIKYDTKGRLRPGFLPYYDLKPTRNGRSPYYDRGYSRHRRSPYYERGSPRYIRSPRYERGPRRARSPYYERGSPRRARSPYCEKTPSRNGRSPHPEKELPRRSRSISHSSRYQNDHPMRQVSYSPPANNYHSRESFPSYQSREFHRMPRTAPKENHYERSRSRQRHR